jgi:hypothetical protein
MEWEGDTCLYRSAPETLRVKNNLQAIGNVSAGNSISAKRVIAQQEVTGYNLILADTPPPSAQAPFGAIHQNSVNGDLSVNTAAGWKQLAVADGIMPVGAIIQSVEPPTVMNPKGWVLLDGTVVSESDPQYTRLFTLSAFNFDGPPGARTLTLPNAMGKMLRGGVSGVGNSGGSDKVTLTVNNMPRHNHNVRTASGGGSSASGRTSFSTPHTHTVNGGLHGHPVSDPGHNHNGGEYPAGAFVCLVWGGQNKIDALFNDRNHTYSVESVQWTRPNTTGISVGSTGSEHNHDVSSEGAHDHAFALDPIAAHTHPVGEDDAGLGQSFDIVPSYLTTYTYIRA